MEERHERVLSACCLALGSLLELLLPPVSAPNRSSSAPNLVSAAAAAASAADAESPPAAAAAAAVSAVAADGTDDVVTAVQAVIGRGGFFKTIVGSKSTMVRRWGGEIKRGGVGRVCDQDVGLRHHSIEPQCILKVNFSNSGHF